MLKRDEKIGKILLSSDQIQERIQVLGDLISKKYADVKGPILMVGVLKGCFLFLSDLCRAIDLPVEIEFMGVSSYGNETKSSGTLQITHEFKPSVKDRHVILVEDIIDTGLTAKYLLEHFSNLEPASLALCAFLEKPSKSHGLIPIDFLGFSIPDEFVVGYGLDFAGTYRNLPYVGVMESAVWK